MSKGKYFYHDKFFDTKADLKNEIDKFVKEKITKEDFNFILESFLFRDIWINISTHDCIPNGAEFMKFVEEVFEKAIKDFISEK